MNTKSNLQKVFTFNPSNQSIRVEVINDEPWFCVADLCGILGHTNPSVAIQMLDEDERAKKSLGREKQSIGNDIAWFVNESGLYNLIFRSNKPEAKSFRKWVTSEVLPAIRKTGQYKSPYRYEPETNRQLVDDFTMLAYRELLKIDSKPVRNRLAGLIEFLGHKITD
jgi:prophage antirepressor-like protein